MSRIFRFRILLVACGCLGATAPALAADSFFDGVLDLANLDGTNGFLLRGIDPSDFSGISVSGAGDVNNDGVADLIIGAFQADPNGNGFAGESYLIFGGAGVGSGGALDLSSLNGTSGFVLNGIDPGDYSGRSVSGAGDVNGDLVADLIIGAIFADPNGNGAAGESYVVFGGAGVGASGALGLSSLNGTSGFVLNGIDPGDLSGYSVSGAGDVNGDGVADLIIGAYQAAPNGNGLAGESYVVFGGAGVGASGSLDLSGLNGTNGFVLNGIDPGDFSGYSVSGAGDVNGDGVEDLIIGAYLASPNGNSAAGETYVVFGGAGVGGSGALELSSLNGSNGFVLNGIYAGDASGSSVSGAGDVNGDGVADLIIGAYQASPNGNMFAGESYVVFGVSGFTWTPLAGGSFDTAGNWLGGSIPGTTGGVLIIRPDVGGTISGPAGTVIVDRLTLGTELAGTATLNIPGSGVILVRKDATIQEGGRLTGDGTFAVLGGLTNDGEIDLGTNSLQVSSGPITNNGLIRGAGRIDAPISNFGRIEAFDQPADMELDEHVTNEATGLVAVRASVVRLGDGLDNQGQVSFGTGLADLFGDVANTGQIGLASDATVNLVGDVAQNGTLNLLAGSRLIVFDEFSGTGGTTGGGTLEVLGTLSPGTSPAEVSFGGDLILGTDTLFELGGTDAGEFDRLVVGGEITLNGLFDVSLIDSFTPELGNAFEIVAADGGINGSFAAESLPDLGALLVMDAFYDANTVTLAVVPALAGDYNADGAVNAADYTVWRNTLNQAGIGLPADGTGPTPGLPDGVVDQLDYAFWKSHYGDTIPGSGSSLADGATNVPEPGGLALAVAAIALATLSRFGIRRARNSPSSGDGCGRPEKWDIRRGILPSRMTA